MNDTTGPPIWTTSRNLRDESHGEPVTLRLTTAGFDDWIFHNRDEKQTALKAMDPYAMPSHPTVPDVPLR